jgi:hypothetical protein
VVPRVGAHPALELVSRNALVLPDRNKADLAAGDKSADAIDPHAERFGRLRLSQ